MSNAKPQILSLQEFMKVEGNVSASIALEKTETGLIFTLSGPNVYRRMVFEGSPDKIAEKVQKAFSSLVLA